MTSEQKAYEKGFEKCKRCGCLRPAKALSEVERICLDGWCFVAVTKFEKGGGK